MLQSFSNPGGGAIFLSSAVGTLHKVGKSWTLTSSDPIKFPYDKDGTEGKESRGFIVTGKSAS